MTILESIVLGLIQGFTEFIPISSSGHLLVFQQLFDIEEPMLTFGIVVHIATLIPIVIVFWKDIWNIITHPFQKYNWMLLLAIIPAAAFGFLLDYFVTDLNPSIFVISLCFLYTALLLFFSDTRKNCYKKDEDITVVDALTVGGFQAVAVLPGISRSGSTIAGALWRNIDRETAAKFSFLISIPIILGAACYEVLKVLKDPSVATSIGIGPMICGFFAALISGYIAVRFMMALIKKCKLRYFAYYLVGFVIVINIYGILR